MPTTSAARLARDVAGYSTLLLPTVFLQRRYGIIAHFALAGNVHTNIVRRKVHRQPFLDIGTKGKGEGGISLTTDRLE